MEELKKALLNLINVIEKLDTNEIDEVSKAWGFTDDFGVETFIGHAIDHLEIGLVELAMCLDREKK